jgi:hypothetical protein
MFEVSSHGSECVIGFNSLPFLKSWKEVLYMRIFREPFQELIHGIITKFYRHIIFLSSHVNITWLPVQVSSVICFRFNCV